MPSAARLPLLLTCAGLWLLTGCARMGLVGETSRPPEVTQAQVALAQGDEKRARARFDAYLRADPTDPMRYLWVAEACSAPPTRRNNLAIEYLQRGLAATPRAAPDLRAQLYTQIGAAWDALGEYDRSLEAYKVAYKLTPDSPLAMNNLGYGYAQMPEGSGDLNEALKLTTHAVTLSRERGASDAELGVFLDSLGWVQYKMRAYDEAITTLGDAVSLVASAGGPFGVPRSRPQVPSRSVDGGSVSMVRLTIQWAL